jgi:hypothetical protein
MGELLGHELRADGSQVEPKPEKGSLADRDIAILGPLAATDKDGSSVEVHVFHPEADEFTSAQSTGIENLKNCPIPQAQRGPDIWNGEHPGHLAGTESRLWELAIWAGHEKVGGRVQLDPVLASQPGEELCHRDEALHLGPEGQGETISLSIVEQLLR